MRAILLSYRKKCSPNSPSGQLIIPDTLRVLPLFTLCTHKMLALRPNSQVRKGYLYGRRGRITNPVESCRATRRAVLGLLGGLRRCGTLARLFPLDSPFLCNIPVPTIPPLRAFFSGWTLLSLLG